MEVYFGDILEIKNGRNQKKVESPNGRYPIYGSGGIMGYADEYICESDTVVIGRKGSINNPIYVTEPFWNVDTAFGLVANRDVLNPRYLYYFCKHFDFQKLNKTVTIPSLTKSDLLKIRFELPILDEQKRIVKLLDRISEIIDLQNEELKQLDLLVKARFVEMFGDPEINSRGLQVLGWKDVFITTTGKLDSNEMTSKGKYPFFTCAKESFWIDQYAFDCEALLLAGNNAAGNYDVKHYKGKFNAYQRTYVLRFVNGNWSYVLFKIQLENKLEYLRTQSKGTNTRYLTMGILESLQFIIPDIDEQIEFETFVHQTDKLKAIIQKQIEKTNLLFDSLMQQYFGY